jgi:hypothetical protein
VRYTCSPARATLRYAARACARHSHPAATADARTPPTLSSTATSSAPLRPATIDRTRISTTASTAPSTITTPYYRPPPPYLRRSSNQGLSRLKVVLAH